MNETTSILAAIIYGVFGLATVILTARLSHKVKSGNLKIEAVREQVENGHSRNMREESDERHITNTSKLDSIVKTLRAMSGRITTNGRATRENTRVVGILATRVTALTEASLQHEQKIFNIEHTVPRPPMARKH